MKTNTLQNKFFLVALFMVCSFSLFAQTPLDPDPVPIWFEDFNSTTNNNTVESFDWISSSTPINSNLNSSWVWKSNGAADGGAYWGSRNPIQSSFDPAIDLFNGALVFNADVFNLFPLVPGQFLSFTDTVRMENPVSFDSLGNTLYLKFTQYYRDYGGTTTVLVSNDAFQSGTPLSFEVNTATAPNWETENDSEIVLDISDLAIPNGKITVSFIFSGPQYFWIIDDVGIYTENPKTPTIPRWVGESLTQLGYPYAVDEQGGAYVPDQYVIKFRDTLNDTIKDQFRDDVFHVANYTQCLFNPSIELWYYDENNPGQLPLPDINEIKRNLPDSTAIEEIDLNHYTFGDSTFKQLEKEYRNFNDIPRTPKHAKKIVVMDTGVDYKHPALKNSIWRGTAEYPFESDALTGASIIGWDFVGDLTSHENGPDDKYPMDMHSHGTHVAGTVVKALSSCQCPYRIIPVRTHDQHGFSTMFDVACAFYYAISKDVDYINASFGYHGLFDDILDKAVEDATAAEIIVITSSGNTDKDLSVDPAYPANFTKGDNRIFTVGSHNNTKTGRSDFSNFSTEYVDHYAEGEEVQSSINGGTSLEDASKTGTSMAAPFVTAMVVLAECACNRDTINAPRLMEFCDSQDTLGLIDPNCLNPETCDRLFEPGGSGGFGDYMLYIIGLLFAIMTAVLYNWRKRSTRKN